MRVSKIIKDKDGYRLLCRFTMEDMGSLLEKPTKDKLMELEFPIENMSSAAGFWFRLCAERHWGRTGEYLVEPPRAEEESAPPSRRGRKGESRYARRSSS